MRVAQNQQRSQARQHEHATKQQYQQFNSSSSHSFESASSPRPPPSTAVTPPSSAKSVVTLEDETHSRRSSSSSMVRKQALDAHTAQELTMVRQARRDATPSGSSIKSCTSFGSASFSESSEHKLVRSFWKSPAIFFVSLCFSLWGFSQIAFAIVLFFFPDRLMSCPFVLCFVGLGGLV